MALVVYDAVIKSGIQCGISAMSASFCCLHQEKWKLALKYIKMAEEFDPTSTRIQENREYIVQGDFGVSQWTFTGTAADGSRIETDGVDIFTFKNGKIASKNAFRKARPNLPAVK